MADLPKYIETPIESLDETYDRLWATFATHKTLDIAYRLYNLKQLAFLLTDNAERIHAAVNADLSKGSFDVDMSDIWPALNEIEMAVRRLPEWMKDDKATKDATAMFKLSRPRIVKQPKGVALIIGAWNYPWLLSIGPLIGAIAAGCPAVVKCSEHAPASAALFAELLPRYLDPDGYAVVTGGPEQSTQLLKRRWGHVLFTGNGAVGKIVAEAAAKTLTPSTLELGGKSPVIITSDADLTITARRMLSIKQLNVGQMCVSPDYVLCAKDRVEEFAAVCVKTLDEFFPKGSDRSLIADGPQAAALRADRDFDRIESALEAASSQGKVIYHGEKDRERRRMGISLVRFNKGGEGEDSLFVKEEIFGPVLPIIAVDDVDAAIKYINDRPNPLALTVCSSNRAVFEKVIRQTVSGSALWNDFSMAPIARNLPFGGVGESGWGAYHGYDGFLTFSHRKSVLEVPLWMEIAQKNRYPSNMTPRSQRLLRLVMTVSLGFKRPVSVEHERRAIERARTRKHLAIGVVVIVLGAWLGIAGRDASRSVGGVLSVVRAKLGF